MCKLLLSLVAGAASMTLLGFCSFTAGESNAANEYKSKSNDDHMEKGYQSIAAGTGTWDPYFYTTSFLTIRCMYANLCRVRLLPVLLRLRDPLRRGDFYFAALLRIEQRTESHSVAARDRHRYDVFV